MSRTLRVAVASAPARYSEDWRPREVSWADYKTLLGLDTPGSVKDCGGVFGGALAGTNKVDEAVQVRSVVYLDADRADSAFITDLLILLGDVALVWHTTYSYTRDEPRYRVHLPLSRDVTGFEAEQITLALVWRLGRDRFDLSCAQPSRMMYLASAANGEFAWGATDSRVPLDADEWLKIADDEGVTAVLRARRASRASLEEATDDEPTSGQRDKAYSILRKAAREVAENTAEYDGRNNALMAWLPTLYRLHLGGCIVERDEIDAQMWEAACAAPGPDVWTQQEHGEVSLHAWDYAEADGPGRPTVEARVEDDFGVVAMPTAVARIEDLFTTNPARWKRQGGGVELDVVTRHIDGVMPIGIDALEQRLLTFRGGVWRDGESDVAQAINVIFGDMWTPAVMGNLMGYMRTSPRLPRLVRDPAATEFINCRNGMVRWRDGMVEPHDARFGSTVQVPWDYEPGARCPAFDGFLEEVLPDKETVDFVWEVIGYLMFSGNPLHKLVLMWGAKGRNGKGTLLRVIGTLLGQENVSSSDMHSLAENKFRVAELYGRLINIAGDIDARWLDKTAILKALTGGDSMTAERKNQAPFTFTPWAVPVFSANAMFGVNDSSEAFFSRWLVIPFPRTFYDREDIHLTERLLVESEIRGVLSRAVVGLSSLMERGRFEEPVAVKEARAEMGKVGDSVRRWLDEHCDLDETAWTPRTDLWNRYHFEDGDGEPRVGRSKFYARLDQIRGVSKAQRQGVDGFRGVALREESS